MNTKGQIGIVLFLCLAALAGMFVLSGFETIPAGHVGVPSFFGDVEDQELESGMRWAGFFVNAVSFSTQVQKVTYDATAASKDLQIVSTQVAVNFKIPADRASDIYKTIGLNYEDVIISPVVQEAVKANTAKYTAENLVGLREEVKQSISESITNKLEKNNILVTEVSITNFDFSPEFNKAIEQKQVAQQLALQAENDLTRIRIEKEQTITRAQAEAESTKARAEAEAYALRVVNLELEKAKDLIQYKQIEKWDGKLPIFMTSGSSSFLMQVSPTGVTG
ncbi:MAG: SPFH domain-containing protein [bacterium]|nr:SPFH domain-containing protein [bacterium]